ncbi:MAG TPA: hypothetical protein VH396_17875 [Chitinophagaceae bacterium]
MSQTITAQLQDPRINDIRNSVNQKNDAIPFLLLPVRIETRFMQMQRQPPQNVTIETVLEGMGFFHVQVIDTQSNINGDTIRALITEANNIITALQSLGIIAIKEKGWLKQLYYDIRNDALVIIIASQNSFVTESQQLNAVITQLQSVIDGVPIEDDRFLLAAKSVVDSFTTTESSLKALNGGHSKLPYNNEKNKKDLYNYISRTLSDTKTFYQNIDARIKAINYITKNQTDRINQLHSSIKALLGTTNQSLTQIHSDAAWGKFLTDTVQTSITGINTLIASFDTNTLPLLATIPPPPAMQTGDILFHGIQTYVKIKKFNISDIKGYDAVKKYKRYLEPRINTLAKVIQSPVDESKPDQAKTLQSLYASINTELSSSIARIQSFTTQNISQNFGKTMIATYFNTDVSSIIGGWAGEGASDFPRPVFNPPQPEIVNQLWVRVYPDDIFVITHEEDLSQNELDAGQQFWKTWWTGTNDRELELAAWRILCTALGSKRASWVARVLDPRKMNSAKNQTALQNKPSAKIVDAINLADTSNQQLKQVPFNSAATAVFDFLIANQTLQTLNTNFQKIKTETALSSEQQYLVDKLKVLLIKSASYINQLIKAAQQIDANNPANNKYIPSLTLLQTIVDTFNLIQSLFNKIQPLSQKDFVDKFANPFEFPQLTIKDKDWSAAPYTDCLPDRFVVITTKGDQFTQIAVGNPVNPKLQLGLDPQKFDDASVYSIDENGNLKIDDGIKWMADYNEAVAQGMGITLDITEEQYNEGFDRVIVLGVKDADATISKQMLEKLITNHIYSADGMSFLKVGTPTNNTHLRKSGYADKDDIEERFNIEINNIKYDSTETDIFLKADGKYFSDALGLDNGVLQYANNSSNQEIANAFAANRAMWSATFGHYMEEMWDSLFNYDNIRRTEEFFTNYCLGRGVIPSVRIGTQPYGILTTTAFSQLQLYTAQPDLTKLEIQSVFPWSTDLPALNSKLQQRFEMRLYKLLNILKDTWTALQQQNVIHAGNLYIENGDPQQRFVQMLGLHATSLDYYYRYGINIARGPNATADGFSTNFKSDDPFAPAQFMNPFKDLMREGIFYPSFIFNDEDSSFILGFENWMINTYAYDRVRDQFIDARLYVARLVENSLHITGNLVDTLPVSDESLLSNIKNAGINYIDWLLSKDANSILGGNAIHDPARIPSETLLFLMLRQSLLQSYQEAALNILQREGLIAEPMRRLEGSKDRYHYKIFQNGQYRNKYLTKWHFLFKNLTDLVADEALPTTVTSNPFYTFINSSPLSLANYLDRVMNVNPQVFNSSHLLHFNKLKTIREAIQSLKRASTESLEILLAEHIDLCTYRLDAWLLGFVIKRLQQQRTTQSQGIFFGAYGYVENLRRDSNKQEYNQPDILTPFKLEENKPVYHDPDNEGFIHGPSISQAITAAVLRNAYMTNNEADDIQNRLAVNISSARVRMALQLIEGMRNGQEVGAILGFQFERGLHDRYQTVELDKFIQPFRQAFPLQQKVQEVADGEPAYVSLVVNGSAILDLVYDTIDWFNYNSSTNKDKTVGEMLKENNFEKVPQKIKDTIDGSLDGSDDKTTIYNSIIEEIDRMADAFDALGDLAISESVYQMVLGNHVRAAAVLSALAEGKNIPDPGVIDTQRTGTIVTQKVLLNFVAVSSSVVPTGWSSNSSVRALTEPSFNNWLGKTFGSPDHIKYVLTITDTNSLVTKESFAVTDLHLQPLDIFLLPGAENELKEIIITLYRIANKDFTSAITLDIQERDGSWTNDDKSINELFLLIKHIRNMISNAKYTGAAELMLPNDVTGSNNPGNHDADEFDKRIKGAQQSLGIFIQDVEAETFIQDVLKGTTAISDITLTDVDVSNIFTHLTNAVFLAIPHALSITFDPAATDVERGQAVLQQLLSAYKEAVKRKATADSLVTQTDSITVPKLKVQKLAEAGKAILGKNFLAIPQYTPNDLTDIKKQLALPVSQKISRNGGRVAVEDWLQNIARVRKRMYDVTMYRQIADVYDLPEESVQPAQLSYATGDYWLGIEYPSSYTPSGDKLSLILINEQVLNTSSAQCGLVIDEWLEIIPVKEETTGITFNYNQPNASAPQSVLLAVTPSITNQWEWDDLVYTIIDTIELARNRAVEPDHIDKSFLNQVLPSVFAEVVPPQFRNEDVNPLGVQAVMDFADVIPPPQN